MILNFINTLYWQNPEAFFLLSFPFIIASIHYFRQQKQWLKIAETALLPWIKNNNEQAYNPWALRLLVFAWLFLVIALAGPKTILNFPPQLKNESQALVFIFDFSSSMNANDEHPSRKSATIKLAKHWLKYHNAQQHPIKLGLILFAGHAFELVSPTDDTNLLKHFITQMEGLSLPTAGNNLASAIELATQQLMPYKEQRIIIFTDGDLSKKQHQLAESIIVKLSGNSALEISFIGVGSIQGSKIPNPENDFIKNKGRIVLSRLQNTWLNQIKQFEAINYFSLEQAKQLNLVQISNLPRPDIDASNSRILWQPWFFYPLNIGVFILLLALFLHQKDSHKLQHFAFILLIFLGVTPNSSHANSLSNAQFALSQSDYKMAQQQFGKINSFSGYYGKGISCYRLKDFKCAQQAFSKSAWLAKTDLDRAQAVFNLANSHFYLTDYLQASVLYQDAINLGFDQQKALNNKIFTLSIITAIQRQIKDIKETFRRAKFKAAATGNPAPNLQNMLSAQRSLLKPKGDSETEATFQKRQLIQQGLSRLLNDNSNNSTTSQWIKTDQIKAQSGTLMLKRLFELELGIPASLKQAQKIAGEQKW